MIPQIIHQTWKTPSVPVQLRSFVESWKRFNPDWEYRLWTDSDCRMFISDHYPWFLEQFDSYERGILRADAIRYFLLHHFGGVYADLDFECLQPLSRVCQDGHSLFLGEEPKIHATTLYDREQLVCNALMASEPGHPFWPHVFDQLVDSRFLDWPTEQTGPIMLQEAFNSYAGGDVHVYADNIFYPLPCLRNTLLPLSRKEKNHFRAMQQKHQYPSESVAVHHWEGMWYTSRFRKATEWISWHLCSAIAFRRD